MLETRNVGKLVTVQANTVVTSIWDGIYTSKKAGRKRKRRITTRTRRKEEEKEQEVEPYINQEQEGK